MSGPARERPSALRVFRRKSVFYGAFVWARRALNMQKRRFSARAVVAAILLPVRAGAALAGGGGGGGGAPPPRPPPPPPRPAGGAPPGTPLAAPSPSDALPYPHSADRALAAGVLAALG
jgi:hypothetical protein